jgi:hypothetical protein
LRVVGDLAQLALMSTSAAAVVAELEAYVDSIAKM